MITTIIDKFDIENANSKGLANHEPGDIPFVTNGISDNGIVGHVTPLPKEKVFTVKAICVSSFCEATVQKPPFLPRGNGGSGLIVLIPKQEMSYEELYSYASQINRNQWKFSFGRMVTVDRLKSFALTDYITEGKISQRLKKLTASHKKAPKVKLTGSAKERVIEDVLDVAYGQKEYENKGWLEAGSTILISSKGEDKGVYGFFNIEPYYKAPIITVPRTGTIGHAFVQEFDCCANSDCLVLTPKPEAKLTVSDLRQIAYQIRSIKWKYNYGRKITPERLKKELVVYYPTAT